MKERYIMYKVVRSDGFVVAECEDYSTALEIIEANLTTALNLVDDEEYEG